MSFVGSLGRFDARIEGFDNAKLIAEISKIPNIISLSAEGDAVFVTLPFIYRKRLEQIAESSGSAISFERERGIAYFISRYIRRFGIFAGAVFCIAACIFLSNIILDVRVVGANSSAVEAAVKDILRQEGIRAGGYIPSVNFLCVQAKLFNVSQDISWVSIGHSGSVVTVNISMPTDRVKTKEGRIPCNIVASRDGRIVSADVLAGEFTSLIGSGVKKGDILVSGIVDNKNGNAYYRHSIAKIIAEYDERVVFEQNLFDRTEADGKTTYVRSLCFFEYEIPLPSLNRPSENSRVLSDYTPIMLFGLELPIGVKTESWTEIITKNKIFTEESARKLLEKRLDTYEKNILKSQEIVQKNVSIEVDNDVVRLTADYVLRGDIAKESEIFVDDKRVPAPDSGTFQK